MFYIENNNSVSSLVIETEDPANISADKETVITLTEKVDPGKNITEDANRSTWVQAVGLRF